MDAEGKVVKWRGGMGSGADIGGDGKREEVRVGMCCGVRVCSTVV